MKTWCLLLPLLLAAWDSPADGASFDCRKAGSRGEKLICADGTLSKADESLSKAYTSALTGLSGEAKVETRAGQREWLKFIAIACRLENRGGIPRLDDTKATACLNRSYLDRVKHLTSLQQNLSGLLLRNVHHFSAQPIRPNERRGYGYFKDINTIEIRFPQIDSPTSEGQRRWNDIVRNRATRVSPEMDEGGIADVDVDYDLIGGNQEFISVRFTESDYPHGVAHSIFSVWNSTFIFNLNREMASADIFDQSKDWMTPLASQCRTIIERETEERRALKIEAFDDFKAKVADAERWTLHREGLEVFFKVYELGSYASGAQMCRVSWVDLAPYLLSSPAVTLPPT